MGFFDRLFGGGETTTTSKKQARAQHKDVSFFKIMFEKKRAIIESYRQQNVALKQQGKLRPVNNWVLAMEHLDLVYLNYSIGNDINLCYNEYVTAAGYYGEGWDADAFYADMIDMIALGSLLNVPDDVFEPVINYIRRSDTGSSYPTGKPDALLWYIINNKKPGSGPQPDALITEAYRDVYNLTKMPNAKAGQEMKLYLDKWYRLHKDDPWYENHKKERVYKGYWCWEAAAITKIMGLDNSSYANHPHYPYDIVHLSV